MGQPEKELKTSHAIADSMIASRFSRRYTALSQHNPVIWIFPAVRNSAVDSERFTSRRRDRGEKKFSKSCGRWRCVFPAVLLSENSFSSGYA